MSSKRIKHSLEQSMKEAKVIKEGGKSGSWRDMIAKIREELGVKKGKT
ncbi:hypothetical protein P8825_15080 [Shouchella clausii]|nr:hypothetical protein [Shouchella clausii]MEB5480887.1 hypothetical protein [Shouchella clausii]